MEITSKAHEDFMGCRRIAARIVANALLDIKKMTESSQYRSSWHHAYDWVLSPDFEWWCGEVLELDAISMREGIVKVVEAAKRKGDRHGFGPGRGCPPA